MSRIFLVRHGESQANVDQSLHKKLPDHEIALSSRGLDQPAEAAKCIGDYYASLDLSTWNLVANHNVNSIPPIILWNSPYRRTRDTAKLFNESLLNYLNELVEFRTMVHGPIEAKENILLCEQQFGLFDGLKDDEIERKYPNEFKTWKLCKKYNGKFWARYPMGESPFDTAVRIHQSFDEIRDAQRKCIDQIIVCHGTVVKLFIMMWFGYSPEWFAEKETIGNCGIYLIDGVSDKTGKVIFGGYKKGKLVEQ